MDLLTFLLCFLWEFLCVPYTLTISNNCYQMCIFSKYNFPESQIVVSYSLMNISTQDLNSTSDIQTTLTDLSLSTIWIHLINLSNINHTVFQNPTAFIKPPHLNIQLTSSVSFITEVYLGLVTSLHLTGYHLALKLP